MLTEREREWLNERQICLACEGSYIWGGYWEDGVELETMQEAAEFEQRVAAKLAEAFMGVIDTEFDYQIPSNCAACPCKGKCSLDCKDSILKWARLQVEEEMDNEP